ncbi:MULTISPECIES: hypothetical protein [Nocardiaceae]|uniref:hypothetical protein n=1 Tax=Nocardiaceae TaxID=85025 RepID=UPI001140358E|nr:MULTISPECIES: hypothetical protein [Rhodococcus]
MTFPAAGRVEVFVPFTRSQPTEAVIACAAVLIVTMSVLTRLMTPSRLKATMLPVNRREVTDADALAVGVPTVVQ